MQMYLCCVTTILWFYYSGTNYLGKSGLALKGGLRENCFRQVHRSFVFWAVSNLKWHHGAGEQPITTTPRPTTAFPSKRVPAPAL